MEINIIKDYQQDITRLITAINTQAVQSILERLHKLRLRGGRLFVAGNGGSGATVNHFACDLGKNALRSDQVRFCIISLSCLTEAISAYGNDEGYETVFIEQLKNFAPCEEDIVLLLSASGNSPNIIKAAEYARGTGSFIISFTGFEGGKLKGLSGLNINVASNCYEKIEDIHLILCHMLVYLYKENKGDRI